jgi:hypothetical protein
VRVFKGKNEVTEDVFVTDVGANPPKVELRFGALKPAGTGAATTGAATAAPTTTTPPAQPGIIDKFE